MTSIVEELITALQARPGSLELRELLADALEEQGDPRGGWLRRGLHGDPAPEALADVRTHAPGARRIRFEAGLLVELELDSPADPDWLTSHPLLLVDVSLPWRPEELQDGLRRWTPVVEAVHGVRITGGLGENLPRVLAWLAGFSLERLWISLAASAALEGPVDLPTVRSLAVHGGTGVLETLLRGCTAIEHLRLRGVDALPGISQLPALRCLDVRGVELPLPTRQALAQADFEVVHGRFELHPTCYDPFGLQGWSRPIVTTARAVVTEDEGDFGIVRDETLYTYDQDQPLQQAPFIGSRPERSRRCGGTLARVESDRVLWGERSWDLGEPVRGLVASPSHLWAIAGRQVWQLHPRTRVVGSCEHAQPALSARGATLAWTPSATSVEVFLDPDEHHHAAYPGSYQGSEEPIVVADLLVLPGRVLVVLEHGGANLLQLGNGQAQKLDAFPGEHDRSWVFVWDGQILIAE